MGKAILLCVSLVFALGCAEVLSRYLAPSDFMRPMTVSDPSRLILHRPSTIPGLGYELVPNAEMAMDYQNVIHINSQGMRDDELVRESELPICTIDVLGDSFTFAFAVRDHETYPNVLESLLASEYPNRRVQVNNLGVTGYNTSNEVALLKTKLDQWHRDLVIVGYVLNDPELVYPWAATPLFFHEPALWQYSNLARLVAETVRARGIDEFGDGLIVRYLHAEGGEGWRSVTRGLDELHQLSQEHGFQVLLAIFPMIDAQYWYDYRYRDVHAKVAETARSRNLPVVDLLDAFRRHEPGELIVSPSDSHPSVLGHRVAAEAVAAAIRDMDLLGGCPARMGN